MLGFVFFFYNFRDAPSYARDPSVLLSPMNFPKIWGVSPHLPHVHFPAPILPCPRNLVEHYKKQTVTFLNGDLHKDLSFLKSTTTCSMKMISSICI
jgi:hypothetical protein